MAHDRPTTSGGGPPRMAAGTTLVSLAHRDRWIRMRAVPPAVRGFTVIYAGISNHAPGGRRGRFSGGLAWGPPY